MTTKTPRLSTLSKPSKPPSPPLFPRPKLPIPTISNDTPANVNEGNNNESSTGPMPSRPSSGASADAVLRLMDALCVAPDEDVYISLLRDSVDAAEVATVHAHISVKCAALGLPLLLANRLLLAYVSCGDTVAGRKVFDEMPVKNGITWELAGDLHDHAIVAVLRSCARLSKLSFGEQVHALVVKTKKEPVPEAAWTSFMTSCHRHGLLDEAIHVCRDMVSSGVARSSFSLSSILAVCAESENDRCLGRQVHADAIKHSLETNQFVVSGLVHIYANQGKLADAARAFKAVGSKPDAVCWSTMAMGYARSGWYREAARMIYQMKAAGIDPPGLDVVRMACSR
ncbi:unnamed protein product [Alopecurus aequalis]